MDTVEIFHAKLGFKAQDLNESELLNCEEDMVHGLKTAT